MRAPSATSVIISLILKALLLLHLQDDYSGARVILAQASIRSLEMAAVLKRPRVSLENFAIGRDVLEMAQCAADTKEHLIGLGVGIER